MSHALWCGADWRLIGRATLAALTPMPKGGAERRARIVAGRVRATVELAAWASRAHITTVSCFAARVMPV